MCGGGSKPAAAATPVAPKPDTTIADRGTDTAANASGSGLSSGKAPTSTTDGGALGGSGTGLSSVLGG